MAATAAARLGLALHVAHLDRTSLHVDGRDHRNEEPEAQGVPMTRGYSRDHRPDFNPVMLELIVAHQAGIPILMQPLSGNRRDAQDFSDAVRTHVQQWQTTYGLTSLVADSALYSEANLQKLAQPPMQWITRVPATVNAAQTVLAQADPQALASLQAGYRNRELTSTYGGIAPRWGLIDAESRRAQVHRTIDKPWRQRSDKEINALKKLCGTAFACEADAPQALTTLEQDLHAAFLNASMCVRSPTMANGGEPDKRPDPPRWSTRSTGRWLCAHCSASPHRSARLWHPGHQCAQYHPTAAARGVGRVQRPGARGAWVPMFARPAVFSFFAVSEKAHAHHGPVDGDDRLLVGVCRLGIPYSASAQTHIPHFSM
jgi:hypothetical protein